MKKIDYYLSLPYMIELTPDTNEGGFVASYPDLPGCFSSGKNAPQAIKNSEDAKKAWLEAALEEGIEISEPVSNNEFSGQFKLRIPKSLHKKLAVESRREGISMNQYCLYLLSMNFEKQRKTDKTSESYN